MLFIYIKHLDDVSSYRISRPIVTKRMCYLKNCIAPVADVPGSLSFTKIFGISGVYISKTMLFFGQIYPQLSAFVQIAANCVFVNHRNEYKRKSSQRSVTSIKPLVISSLRDAPSYIYCLVTIRLRTVCLSVHFNA